MIFNEVGLELSYYDILMLHNNAKIVGKNRIWPNEDTSFWVDTTRYINKLIDEKIKLSERQVKTLFIYKEHIPILYSYVRKAYEVDLYGLVYNPVLPNCHNCIFANKSSDIYPDLLTCTLVNDIIYDEIKCTPEEWVRAGTLEIIKYLQNYKPSVVNLTIPQKFELWCSKWLQF